MPRLSKEDQKENRETGETPSHSMRLRGKRKKEPVNDSSQIESKSKDDYEDDGVKCGKKRSVNKVDQQSVCKNDHTEPKASTSKSIDVSESFDEGERKPEVVESHGAEKGPSKKKGNTSKINGKQLKNKIKSPSQKRNIKLVTSEKSVVFGEEQVVLRDEKSKDVDEYDSDLDEGNSVRKLKREKVIPSMERAKQVNLLPSVLNYGSSSISRKSLNKLIFSSAIRNLHFTHFFSLFERRITALSWHPTNPDILLFASKGGEICCYNDRKPLGDVAKNALSNQSHCEVINTGSGPGGSINTIKFDVQQPHYFYTTAISGELMRRDLGGRSGDVVYKLDPWNRMFNSLDINHDRKMLILGDDRGTVHFVSENNRAVYSEKFHKAKVNHVEIHPHNRNIFVTASGDRTVKVWDIRNLKESKPLESLKHDWAVNRACFSRTDAGTLLTTDQFAQIRLYAASSWKHERTIFHPHRQFQHLTPICASWHPLCDVVIVGRYPHDDVMVNDERSIDFFDATSGELLHQLRDVKHISSLNEMNCTGDTLASGMGFNLVVWKQKSFLAGAHDAIDLDSFSFPRIADLKKLKPKRAKREYKCPKTKKHVESS